MLARGLLFFTDNALPLIGMLLFMWTFLGITGWTFLRRGSRRQYQAAAQMPFDDGKEISHERR